MPFTPRADESGIFAFIRKHAVAIVLGGILLDVAVTGGYVLNTVLLQNAVDDLNATTDRLTADERQQAAQLKCQAGVNADLLNTLHSRSSASREAVLAPQALAKALLPALTAGPDTTPKQQKAILADLVDATRSMNTAYQMYLDSQSDNPIPALPDCSKGAP